MTQYARIRHDTTRPAWNCMSRTDPRQPPQKRVKLNMAPETVRYSGDTGQVTLKKPFQNWISQINIPAAFARMIRIANGWVNKSPWPAVQQVGFGGNLVRVARIGGQRVYVDALPYKGSAPLYKSYQNDPALVHVFTVIDQAGNISLPTNKTDALMCFICLIARKPVYFPAADLEFFPPLPAIVTTRWAVNIRSLPIIHPSNVMTVAPADAALTVLEYEPHGSEVWGLVSYGGAIGYVALYHPSTGYNTTWTMETTPPPVL